MKSRLLPDSPAWSFAPFCHSAVVLDEKAARAAGRLAVLAQTPSPIYVGGAGTLFGRRFNVLGRVRSGHHRGYWSDLQNKTARVFRGRRLEFAKVAMDQSAE